jgi:hypothetical protein
MELQKKHLLSIIVLTPQGPQTMAAEVPNREVEEMQSLLPKEAYAFSLFDVIYTEVEHEDQWVALASEPLNPSPMYFPGAEIVSRTALALQANNEQAQRLAKMMEMQNVDKVIKTRLGAYVPYDDSIVII